MQYDANITIYRANLFQTKY